MFSLGNIPQYSTVLPVTDVLPMSSVTIKVTSPGVNLQTHGESSPQPWHGPTRETELVAQNLSTLGPMVMLSLNPELLVELGKSFNSSALVESFGK